MIKDKIYKFLNLNEDSVIPEEVLSQFTSSITYGLQRQMFDEKSAKGSLRLSVAGKCSRQVYYSLTRYDEARPLEPRTKITFLFGDISEAIVVALAKASTAHSFEITEDTVKKYIRKYLNNGGEKC